MRTPSSQKCRLDLAPPWADRFILGIVPIDCSPALLLMPFGFHLTMDTLPFGVRHSRTQQSFRKPAAGIQYYLQQPRTPPFGSLNSRGSILLLFLN